MTLLAHWKIDEGPFNLPTTAIDSAAGGSGSHDATYEFGSTIGYGAMVPGGVGGYKLFTSKTSESNAGYIHTPSNISDLKLLGEMTVMAWITSDEIYDWNYNRYVVNISGNDATEAKNDLWNIKLGTSRRILFTWEKDAGTLIDASSTTNILPAYTDVYNFSCHIAVVRKTFSTKYQTEFWVNGTLMDTNNNSSAGFDPPTGGSTSLFYIGRDAINYCAQSYCVDSVRVYDSAEDSTSINAVYDSEKLHYESMPVNIITPSDQLIRSDSNSLYTLVPTGRASGREYSGFYK